MSSHQSGLELQAMGEWFEPDLATEHVALGFMETKVQRMYLMPFACPRFTPPGLAWSEGEPSWDDPTIGLRGILGAAPWLESCRSQHPGGWFARLRRGALGA
jgi:hypothetical protein